MAEEAKETTKLLPKVKSPDSQGKGYYFLQRKRSGSQTEITQTPSLRRSSSRSGTEHNTSTFGWFSNLFSSNHGGGGYNDLPDSSRLDAIPRKVPVKIEPKVFFANERTFLAWLHMSVTLASISVAIVAFADANEWSQLYGMLLMPVAIAFCIYSLWMYMKRARMIRRKDPGPYDDDTGPVILAWMLAAAIIVNFFIKLYDLAT